MRGSIMTTQLESTGCAGMLEVRRCTSVTTMLDRLYGPAGPNLCVTDVHPSFKGHAWAYSDSPRCARGQNLPGKLRLHTVQSQVFDVFNPLYAYSRSHDVQNLHRSSPALFRAVSLHTNNLSHPLPIAMLHCIYTTAFT
jgi:hypothetical protein